MASSIEMPTNAFHVRSTSLPSTSNPTNVRVQEHLHQLQSTLSTGHQNIEKLSKSLNDLRLLYCCVEDLLQSRQTRNFIACNENEKWLNEILDASLAMLDMCASARDVFSPMKKIVKDLQSALHRRGGADDDFSHKVQIYITSKKKIQKKIKSCLGSLKQMESKCGSLDDFDTLMGEVRMITVTFFESLLSFISSSRPATKWSLVSKWMGRGRVACETQVEKMNDMERLHGTIYTHSNKSSRVNVDVELAKSSQKQLAEALLSIQGLEEGLDSLLRSFIKIRVSLLNILNY